MYNSFLFYSNMGYSLGVFAVLFQRRNSVVETIWFCPTLIVIMHLQGVSDVNLIDFEVKEYSFKVSKVSIINHEITGDNFHPG